MTYSNGGFNPHPLANPFNTRLGPANYSLNQYGTSYRKSSCKIYSKNSDLKNLKVPDPVPFSPELIQQQKRLEVPNQLDAPNMYSSSLDTTRIQQMFPNNYVDSNGRIYDLDSHRIIYDPNAKSQMNGEWGPAKIVGNYQEPQWDNREIYAPPAESVNQYGIDKKSQDYWNEVNKESSKEMSDLQKELLSELDAGTLVKPSKLELEF